MHRSRGGLVQIPNPEKKIFYFNLHTVHVTKLPKWTFDLSPRKENLPWTPSPCKSMHEAPCILYIQGKEDINNNLF